MLDVIETDNAILAAAETAETVAPVEPVDLWGRLDPPEMPLGLLPPVIEQFALVNASQMGADPAGLAVAALTTCAAAIPDQVQIRLKRHADWRESARLWAAVIGEPSTKKSPILRVATKPLCGLDAKMMTKWSERLADWESLDADAKRRTPKPPETRLRIEDTTVEAAQQVLKGSPWGIMVLQDELSGFFAAMDRYSGGKGGSDRVFWLKTFNGGEGATNRIGRGSSLIPNLGVSLLGGIQPEPLRKVANDTVDDGLMQRMFTVMLRPAGLAKDEPAPPVNETYARLIERLHNLRPPGFAGVGVLAFDDEAQHIFYRAEAEHLEMVAGLSTVNRKLASHVGKYDGIFARLCVLWHCIENAEAEQLPDTVTADTARRVGKFLHDFLFRHSVAFYCGVLGLADDHDRLSAVAGYVLAHKLEKVTNRDVARGCKTMRGLKDFETRAILEQLAALGWLDPIERPRPTSAPHWRVNPRAHVRFAERAAREADQRARARREIQALVAT